MKRELIQNVKVVPYTSGDAIDREGFLSAVLSAKAVAAGNLKIAVTHADTSTGTFEAVPDACLVVGGGEEVSGLKVNDIANFDIDLVGCKQFVKFTLSGDAAATGSGDTAKAAPCAVVLGDPAQAPV